MGYFFVENSNILDKLYKMHKNKRTKYTATYIDNNKIQCYSNHVGKRLRIGAIDCSGIGNVNAHPKFQLIGGKLNEKEIVGIIAYRFHGSSYAHRLWRIIRRRINF